MKNLIAILLISLPATVLAESNWSGEGDLGYNKASGNTDTEALLAKLKLAYEKGDWRHTGEIDAVNSSDDGDRTAESYTGKIKTNYALTETYYVFGNGRYEDNRFSGYEYQASLTSGLGVHLIESERTTLDLEGGAGYRRSKEQDTGQTLNEAIIIVSALFNRRLTDTTLFESDLRAEAGEDNTYVETNLAIKVKINDHLALKLGYSVKHNTEVPEETEKTDTLSSVSLHYSI